MLTILLAINDVFVANFNPMLLYLFTIISDIAVLRAAIVQK